MKQESKDGSELLQIYIAVHGEWPPADDVQRMQCPHCLASAGEKCSGARPTRSGRPWKRDKPHIERVFVHLERADREKYARMARMKRP
jgi:hypothetical protein